MNKHGATLTELLLILILIIGIVIGIYYLHRWINWNLYYEDKVVELIQEYQKGE